MDTTLVKQILKYEQVNLITGGGVRGLGDLVNLERLGVSAVLVSTVLHAGVLTPADLVDYGFET